MLKYVCLAAILTLPLAGCDSGGDSDPTPMQSTTASTGGPATTGGNGDTGEVDANASTGGNTEDLGDTTMLGSGGVPGLHVLAFDDGFTSVAVTSMDQFEDDLDLPTTAAVLGERVWVVNSQLDHFVDLFDNDEPPELPFAVVGIPTSLLGQADSCSSGC